MRDKLRARGATNPKDLSTAELCANVKAASAIRYLSALSLIKAQVGVQISMYCCRDLAALYVKTMVLTLLCGLATAVFLLFPVLVSKPEPKPWPQ